jgi:4,5-DOPA dioxygenase extradiol
MVERTPLLFMGHGTPTNALEVNDFTKGWKRIAKKIPRPRAIVCISAHWLREGTAVLHVKKPKTIHDFSGFPPELYQQKYPAPGSLDLAEKIQKKVRSTTVSLDKEWGLDHGTWSVLKHMYPNANVPVIQLSLDYQLTPEKIYALGKELSFLREEKILLIGSGNLVHNLMRMNLVSKPHAWAKEFDEFVKTNLDNRDDKKIIHYENHPTALLAHPTNDHFLPLLYILGAASKDEKPFFFNEKIVYGSISMRCAAFGL